MKSKFLKLILSIILVACSIYFFSSQTFANPILKATQYGIYQYMDGYSYSTETFSRTSSSTFTINGKFNGGDVYVSLHDATTGNQVGSSKKFKNGQIAVAMWPFSSIPEGHSFYYTFSKAFIFDTIFINCYVLY